jgi:Mlc titration factor MtfA (ptsG expression regulator)
MVLGVTFLLLLCVAYFLFNTHLRNKAKRELSAVKLPEGSEQILWKYSKYYRKLSKAERLRFHRLVYIFLENTSIIGVGFDRSLEDCLLVAASAVIPVMGIDGFYAYPNIREVLLYPDRFNPEDFSTDGKGRNALGMVGDGPLENKMILSKPALYMGFLKEGKENVGIHEFVHLIDKADGLADGCPEVLMQNQCSIPWMERMRESMEKMEFGKGDISSYALKNKAEFFAVTAEYFFQKPRKFRRNHPELYRHLSNFFQQKL